MPFIIAIAQYPSHKQQEAIAKQVQVVSKYPYGEVLKVICSTINTTDKGVKGMFIYEPKEGKFLDALTMIRKLFYNFIDIEGLEYTIETWYTADEAMAIAMDKS